MIFNKKNLLALFLIIIGGLFLLEKIGLNFGHSIISFLIPFVILGIGYLGIKNGKFIGWPLLIIGCFMLLGKFAGILGILLAVGLILVGVHLLKKRSIE
ncbi:LiaF transmembrane domain-containing protein [Chengkuizengella axinellae]|uniref:LiaF transmembrane domain-containing protein n=1 Tax=Chengkuizengella axinellae TaxID=3064388 RepID=A0ABT9IT34_9BACL|nr:hypothetical protein [Chengkuizengella sp. 2205SS18-9]MDP5272509.1 hypothetical protein [Chengkuizengella sp. 2205SS18-9]